MANISQENINSLAQEAFTISDGDYIYIYKSGAGGFARIEKSALFAGISTSGGGMSAEVYAAIQANVETLRSMLYTLVNTYLANLAFNNGKPDLSSIANAFTWPENDGGSGGGDTPTYTPSLSSPTNNSTVNVGTNTGSGVSKTITVKGSNLTKALTASLSGTGFYFGSSGSQTSQTILANNANASSGWTLTVRYEGTEANATGTLTISSSEVSVTVNLTASYQQQGGGDEPTPSDEFSHTAITIKRGAYISGATTSALTTGANTNNACTTQFVELSGQWHHVVIRHGMPQTYADAPLCRVVCKYIKDGVVGVTNTNNMNNCAITNTNNNNYAQDWDNKTVTIYKQYTNSYLDNSSNVGNYEVTAIAFGVRSNPSVTNPTEADWSDNQFNSGTTYVDVYKTADDANPTRIFSSNPQDNTQYTIVE